MSTKAFILVMLPILAATSPQGVTHSVAPPGESTPKTCSINYDGELGLEVVPVVNQLFERSEPPRPVTQISDGQLQAPTATALSGTKESCTAAPLTTTVTFTSTLTLADLHLCSHGLSRASYRLMPDATENATHSKPLPGTKQTNSKQSASSQSSPFPSIVLPSTSITATPQLLTSQVYPCPSLSTPPISEIFDGQIQAPVLAYTKVTYNRTITMKAIRVSTIFDGQIQAPTTALPYTVTVPAVTSCLAYEWPRSTSTNNKTLNSRNDPLNSGACKVPGHLSMRIKNGSLVDSQNRTGYIASNRQFQFDNPPQFGALFTAGWSVCKGGLLALGNSTTFYQCRSGDFENIYDAWWAPQCQAISLKTISLGEC